MSRWAHENPEGWATSYPYTGVIGDGAIKTNPASVPRFCAACDKPLTRIERAFCDRCREEIDNGSAERNR